MPPHNLFDSDCQSSSIGMGALFNSLLSTSLNTLTPMCNDSAVAPTATGDCSRGRETSRAAHSPSTYPMSSTATGGGGGPSSPSAANYASSSSPRGGAQGSSRDPRLVRPPLNPIKPRSGNHHTGSSSVSTNKGRNRKARIAGLSIDVSPSSSSSYDPHAPPAPTGYRGEEPPPRLSCSRNVELRRKSLGERHFFRPVSEDEESAFSAGRKQ